MGLSTDTTSSKISDYCSDDEASAVEQSVLQEPAKEEPDVQVQVFQNTQLSHELQSLLGPTGIPSIQRLMDVDIFPFESVGRNMAIRGRGVLRLTNVSTMSFTQVFSEGIILANGFLDPLQH